jgi:hypothetical protein
MVSVPAPADQFTSIIGDLRHKIDCYLVAGSFGPAVERFFTNASQADYLRSYYPDLVPPKDPAGNPPSEHTLGSIFELHYARDPVFVSKYLNWLRRRFFN